MFIGECMNGRPARPGSTALLLQIVVEGFFLSVSTSLVDVSEPVCRLVPSETSGNGSRKRSTPTRKRSSMHSYLQFGAAKIEQGQTCFLQNSEQVGDPLDIPAEGSPTR